MAPWPVGYDSASGYLCMFVLKVEGSSKSIDAIVHALKVRNENLYEGSWLSTKDARRLSLLIKELRYNDMHLVERKHPIRLSQLNRWTAGMDLSQEAQLMLVVICYLGHDGLLRMGELLSGLTAANIQWSHDYRSVSVILGRSKMNRQGDPERVEIFDHRGRSAVKMLQLWFNHKLLWNSTGLLFPGFRVAKDGVRKTVSGSWARAHIKKLVRDNGLNPDFYSGHSLRAGGATDLFIARVPYFLIKKMGRWKSDAAMIYYRCEQDVVHAVSQAFSKLASL